MGRLQCPQYVAGNAHAVRFKIGKVKTKDLTPTSLQIMSGVNFFYGKSSHILTVMSIGSFHGGNKEKLGQCLCFIHKSGAAVPVF